MDCEQQFSSDFIRPPKRKLKIKHTKRPKTKGTQNPFEIHIYEAKSVQIGLAFGCYNRLSVSLCLLRSIASHLIVSFHSLVIGEFSVFQFYFAFQTRMLFERKSKRVKRRGRVGIQTYYTHNTYCIVNMPHLNPYIVRVVKNCSKK